MHSLHPLSTMIGFAGLIAAAGYAVLVATAVLLWRGRRETRRSSLLPPVSVLKPLCGAEPGLYRHLRSFCMQDYPVFEIIFGVRDPADPACAVVERLIGEFPQLPITLVSNPQLHGSNCKTSNLINMLPHAHHEVLAIADSDAWVGPDYLASVTAPLEERSTGLVTCVYRGAPTPSIWSRLGAMYINEWYMPSVLLTQFFGYQGYVSGQTMCLRRDTLQAVGGFRAMANHLADDYRLGELIRGQGLKVVLSSYVSEGETHEPSLASLNGHELRWMSTIRFLKPGSFPWIFLTFSLPLAASSFALACAESVSIPAKALFGITILARLVLHFTHRWRDKRPLLSDLWLLPLRELLMVWIWCRSFSTSRVMWRGSEFAVDPDGVMHRVS